jgi:hypothetical protein
MAVFYDEIPAGLSQQTLKVPGVGTFRTPGVSAYFMKRDWPLRQLLAVLRGLGVMLALFLALVFTQLAPSLVHGGLSGVHHHIVRVATAGVPLERWGVAIARMYEALAILALVGCVLFWVQRCLSRRLASARGPVNGTTTRVAR